MSTIAPTNIRTTITLENDAYRIAKNLADSRHISLGSAVSELVLKAVAQKPSYLSSDFPVFSVGENVQPFGLNEVQKVEDLDP